MFESYWDRASPLHLSGPAPEPALQEPPPDAVRPASALAADERYLLSLLVGGVSDKAIATQLGLSQRTVQRRIYDLMRRANAETRMQLAWQVRAARLARRSHAAVTPHRMGGRQSSSADGGDASAAPTWFARATATRRCSSVGLATRVAAVSR